MSYKLLQISTMIPYPLVDGGRIGIYHIVKQYALRNVKIDFAAPCSEENNYHEFKKYCNIFFLNIDTRYTLYGGIKNLFSSLPYNVEKYHSAKALQQLEELVIKNSYDAIQVESLHMAWYAVVLKNKFGIPILLREHNYQSEIIRRMCEVVRNPILKLYLQYNYNKMQSYEGYITKKFDKVLTISSVDDIKLKTISPDVNTEIIPAGVDIDYLYYEKAVFNEAIIMSVNYEWYANRDAYNYFVEEIYPTIKKNKPNVKVYIVGKGSELLRKRKNPEGITIEGFIDDFNSITRYASIAVVPLRIGGGMRIKILEMMSKGMAIVSTSVGAEGIEYTNEENIIIADDPKVFAQRVIELLNTHDKIQQIGVNARKFVEQHYSWEKIGDRFYTVLKNVIEKNQ